LTDWVCEDLDIEHSIATRVEVVDGKFTGRGIKPFCYGRGKLYWAEKFAEEHGIDLAASWFYTDSIVDLPMLEAVGHPVAVNPDPRLRAEAKRRGWLVVDDTRTVHISAPRRAA
jgi:phosphoserine phosphatase